MKGILFDMQKFALHDGPGIRTTVFLKGCPLHCVWCCNPESQKLQPQLSYESARCTGCMRCIPACPLAILKDDGKKLSVRFADCSACGKCIDECHTGALKIYGYQTDAELVIAEVMKDKDYYDNSGGGITLSGGEPMVQYEFALELLKLAKANQLHTALETSGYAAREKFENILPYTDLFLFDYKHTGNLLHNQFTLTEPDLILENLDFLCHNGAQILLRCPVIPGINDTADHFSGITELSLRYPSLLGIEVLAYHDYGQYKYDNLGMKAYPIASSTVSKDTLAGWIEQLQNMGCKNLVNTPSA